ncbi:MAG: hypothetical protein KAH01_03270 [Caldisericia bacterium]|nr:hypothetical protein [Caldisericia bacterium]
MIEKIEEKANIEVAEAEQEQIEEEKQPKVSKIWFKKILLWVRNIVLGLLILFVISFTLYLIIPTPTKTVRSFFYSLMNENYPKAYSCIAKGYKDARGDLGKFTFDYDNAVRSGTRTRKIVVTEVKDTDVKNQKIVLVDVEVLYQGSVVNSKGAYLCEKIPSEGWKIVGNVTSKFNKGQPQKLIPQKP